MLSHGGSVDTADLDLVHQQGAGALQLTKDTPAS